MGLFGFGKKPIPNPYTREDMFRDINPSRINSKIYQGNYGSPLTPLSCAISYGSPSIVRELIRNGAEFKNHSLPDNMEMIREFIKNGYVVDAQLEISRFIEDDEPKLDVIKFIISLGLDLNLKDSRTERTPFQNAASRSKSSVLKLLIEAGGNVDTNSYRVDESPLFESILGCSAGIALALGGGHPNIENTRLLVNAGAKPNDRILELAERIGNKEVLKILNNSG